MRGGPVRGYQLEIAQLKAQVAVLRKGLDEFRAHLHSAKFNSPEDWISTGDVLNWLRAVEGDSLEAGESLVGCPKCGRVMEAGQECCQSCGVAAKLIA